MCVCVCVWHLLSFWLFCIKCVAYLAYDFYQYVNVICQWEIKFQWYYFTSTTYLFQHMLIICYHYRGNKRKRLFKNTISYIIVIIGFVWDGTTICILITDFFIFFLLLFDICLIWNLIDLTGIDMFCISFLF